MPCDPLEIVTDCRSPYGERGLKSYGHPRCGGEFESLSLRRAWIEIKPRIITSCLASRRSPYGERGLKSRLVGWNTVPCASLSLRRAWIEIWYVGQWRQYDQSLSLRRAWIEIRRNKMARKHEMSLSLRRAWIEIPAPNRSRCSRPVALLTESVD